jgi:biopolymer transport protein ExbD
MPLKIHDDEPPALNLIPMIDIMFNVILFFLVTSHYAAMERTIPLRVPEVVDSRGALTEAPQPRIIDVFGDETIHLDGSVVTLQGLSGELARKVQDYPGLGVLVRGDANGRFQLVAEVLNACKQAGIQELGISVRLITPREGRK